MNIKNKFLPMIFLGAIIVLSACQGEKEEILIGRDEALSQEIDHEEAEEQEGSEDSPEKKEKRPLIQKTVKKSFPMSGWM